MTEIGGGTIPVGTVTCVRRRGRIDDAHVQGLAAQTLERAGCPAPTIVYEWERLPFGCEVIPEGHDHLYAQGQVLTTDMPAQAVPA